MAEDVKPLAYLSTYDLSVNPYIFILFTKVGANWNPIYALSSIITIIVT
jgi:hypothetical protein